MRIISKEHDFYDGIMRHNYHSDDIIYVRKPVEIKSTDILIPHFYYYTPQLVGFCGRIYPLVKLRYDAPGESYYSSTTVSKYCYNIEECDEAANNFGEAEKEKYFPSRKWKYYN